MNEAERANVNHIAKWDKTSWDNIYNWDGDITIKGDFIKSENGDDEMTDVSKAIYAGDWELYPCKGKVYIQNTTHPKIVLTDAEAMQVWQVLNVWVEREAGVEAE